VISKKKRNYFAPNNVVLIIEDFNSVLYYFHGGVVCLDLSPSLKRTSYELKKSSNNINKIRNGFMLSLLFPHPPVGGSRVHRDFPAAVAESQNSLDRNSLRTTTHDTKRPCTKRFPSWETLRSKNSRRRRSSSTRFLADSLETRLTRRGTRT
jgi:hypothetical protein